MYHSSKNQILCVRSLSFLRVKFTLSTFVDLLVPHMVDNLLIIKEKK